MSKAILTISREVQGGETTQTLKCPDCGKNFAFNPKKHEQDQYVLPPCCKVRVKNPGYQLIRTPEIIKSWEERVKGWRARRDKRKIEDKAIKEVLDKYFPINLITNKRTFGMNDWRRGKRPAIHLALIVQKANRVPLEVEAEIQRLRGMGIRIVGGPIQGTPELGLGKDLMTGEEVKRCAKM